MRRPTWPEIRAALLLFHVVSVAAMSIPGAGITSTRGLSSRTVQADLDDWGAQLDMEPGEMTRTVKTAAGVLLRVRKVLWPFQEYGRITGAKQGWAMFASPQRHPSEVHVEGRRERGAWTLLYAPEDEKATLMRSFMRHNRVRKFTGRFARAARGSNFDGFAAYVAREACAKVPEVAEVRVSLYSYKALERAAVARSEDPKGRYERPRVFPCAAK
jgi:hypothetical protein